MELATCSCPFLCALVIGEGHKYMSGTRRQFSLCDYIVDTATQQTLDCNFFFSMINNPQIEFYDIILVHSSSNYTVVLRYGVNGSAVKHISNDENS